VVRMQHAAQRPRVRPEVINGSDRLGRHVHAPGSGVLA
jgi:hypothetical protein